MVHAKVHVYPGDTLEDRLVRAVESYRKIAEEEAPERCYALDAEIRKDHHLCARIITQPGVRAELDQFLSAADMAMLCGVDQNTPRVWAARGEITRYCAEDGSPRYLVSEVRDMQVKQRKRRAARRKPA